MAAYSQPFYRALLVPDHRINTRVSRNGAGTDATVWSSESSYTEGGPHPSAPEPVTPGRVQSMTLEASGEYVSASPTTILALASKPGHATRTGSGANFVMSPDAGNTFYGWDRPGTVVGQDLLDTSTTDQARGPHLVTLPSTGAVICAYQEVQEAAPGTVAVLTRTRAAATGTWAAEVTAYSGSTDYSSATGSVISNRAGPCMVVLPDERVLLFTLHEDVTADRATVRMFFSEDEGASWALGSKTCLPASIVTSTYTVRRIRAAYLDGQIVLFLWRFTPGAGPSDEILQFASDDLGGSFVQVGSTTNAGLPDVLTVGNKFVVAYVPRSGQSKSADPCWSVLASAWSPLNEEYAATLGTQISMQDAAAFDGSSNIDQASKLCLCQDERGVLFAYWGATDTFAAMQDGTLAATTGTWEPTGAVSIQPIFDFGGGDYLREIAACMQRGRVLLAGSNTASTATTDHYLALWYLGGYTTVELPASDLAVPWQLTTTGAFANIPCTWMPFELPQDTGWTATGTATETLTASGTDWYLHITTAANKRTYEITPTASTLGVMATAVFRSNNTKTAEVYVRASGGGAGADDYACYVRLTNTTISMIDVGSGTTRQSAAHGAGSSFVQILVHVNSGVASVWYRTYSRSESRAWTLLGVAETMTAHSVATTNSIAWGTNSATNDDYDVDFMDVGHISGAPVGRGLATGQTNPDDLHGRPLGGQPVYVADGISVRATGGPAIGADTASDGWQVPVRYDYPVDHLDPRLSSSPRDPWRSKQGTADEYVAWKLDALGDGRMPTDLLGIHLENINHPKWLLEVHNGTSWSTALTLTAYASVAWVREGSSVIITYTSSGFTGVLSEDELVGGAMMFGTTSAAKIRRISRSTVGTVQSSGTPRIPRLYCTGIDNTEGASGTGYVWFPRVTGVFPLAVTSTHVQGVRLRADVDATFLGPPEAYFQAGVAAIGSVYLLGMNPDLGRSRLREAAVDLQEAVDRRRRTRVRAPTRRRVAVSWEGVATNELYGLRDRHVVSDGGGTPVVALRHDVPVLIDGLFDHLDGPHTPIVYLPNVAATGSQIMLQGSVYGRIEGDINLQTQSGVGRREDTDEVLGLSFELVEEV